MVKKGILYCHQNWTDIFNALSLIDYYITIYDELIVLYIDASRPLVEYYIKNKPNVKIIYDKIFLEYFIHNKLDFIKNTYNIQTSEYDILFHGNHDNERIDKYKDKYNENINNNIFFVKAFYSSYDIDYMTRINYFNISRDLYIENTIYDIFTSKHGKNYILYHETIEIERNVDISYVNLNGISSTFFDYIKVLENSIEIHVLDSVWAGLIYLLDCKYGLFESKKIVLYAKRNYSLMFTEPIKLCNWTIV